MAGDITIGGVPCTYKDPGDGPLYELTANKESTRADQTYYCSWAGRIGVHNAILGTVAFSAQAGAIVKGYLGRTIPHQHPEKTWLYGTDAGFKPYIARFSTDANLPAGDLAIMHAIYDSRSYNIVPDISMGRLSDGVNWTVDESWWTGGSFKRYVTTMPPVDKFRVWHAKGGTWRFTDTTNVFANGSFFTITETLHSYVWHAVPVANVPWLSIQAARRSTNLDRWNQFPPQTVVFDGYSLSKPYRPFPDGILVCDITYNFTEKPYGANNAPDYRRGWRFFPIASSAGLTPYTVIDSQYFRNLFRPEAALP